MPATSRLMVLTACAVAAACGPRPADKATDAREKAAEAEASAPVSGPAAPASPPRRKPGLWKQTVSMSGMNQTTRLCLDAATEARMSMWGAQATKDMCTVNQFTRLPDGSWKFVSVCDLGGGGKTTTSGVAKGDFDTSYRMTAESTTTGAASPQMNGAHQMVVEANWEGPCPASFKPGDMELPGGMKFNMLDMGQAGGKAGARPGG